MEDSGEDRPRSASCAERTRRLVPGWDDLNKMATLLVAEHAPEDATVLVVGAGGGTSLPLLGPDDEEALLGQAGFSGTRVFHAGLAFRGWVARA